MREVPSVSDQPPRYPAPPVPDSALTHRTTDEIADTGVPTGETIPGSGDESPAYPAAQLAPKVETATTTNDQVAKPAGDLATGQTVEVSGKLHDDDARDDPTPTVVHASDQSSGSEDTPPDKEFVFDDPETPPKATGSDGGRGGHNNIRAGGTFDEDEPSPEKPGRPDPLADIEEQLRELDRPREARGITMPLELRGEAKESQHELIEELEEFLSTGGFFTHSPELDDPTPEHEQKALEAVERLRLVATAITRENYPPKLYRGATYETLFAPDPTRPPEEEGEEYAYLIVNDYSGSRRAPEVVTDEGEPTGMTLLTHLHISHHVPQPREEGVPQAKCWGIALQGEMPRLVRGNDDGDDNGLKHLVLQEGKLPLTAWGTGEQAKTLTRLMSGIWHHEDRAYNPMNVKRPRRQ
jgi:hypothetical protein